MKLVTNRWVIIFLLLPHISSYYFTLEPLKSVIFVLQFGVVVLALFLLFSQLNAFNLYMIFYALVLLLSSLINGNLIPQVIYSIGILLGFSIYIYYVASKNYQNLITALYYLLSITVIINFFTMITHGVALGALGEEIYFIGNKNAVPITALPAIAVSYLYSYMKYKKIKLVPFIVILISAASCYISASGSGIVVSLLAFAFILIPFKFMPSFRVYFIGYLTAFFSIVVFRLQDVLLNYFITDVLKKNLTFTNRTYIWDFVLSSIKDSWFYGFGRGQSKIYDFFLLNFNETHDGLLEVIYLSGALGLFFFASIMFFMSRKLVATKGEVLSKIISYSVFSFLVLSLTESVFNQTEFWLLIILAYHISNGIKQKEVEIRADNPIKAKMIYQKQYYKQLKETMQYKG